MKRNGLGPGAARRGAARSERVRVYAARRLSLYTRVARTRKYMRDTNLANGDK